MIYDSIKNLSQYAFLGKNFAKAAKFAEENDLHAMQAGHYEIDGENLFINVLDRELTQMPTTWEVHGRYADIQLLLEGNEVIGVCPLSRLAETPVIDAEQDCALFEDLDGSLTELAPGEFIIALPQDIHKPNCPGSKSSRSKKMVFKVLLDE